MAIILRDDDDNYLQIHAKNGCAVINIEDSSGCDATYTFTTYKEIQYVIETLIRLKEKISKKE